MKIFKPFLYCILGFISAFVLMYFLNIAKKMDKEVVIDKDVPIVELQVSTNDIYVGDEVEYSIISRVEPNNEAFESNRTFYYDFTGDGTWDLITKKDTVTYTFIEAYEEGVTPRAAVEFRGKLGQAEGNKIYAKQKIRPILLYNSIGNTVVFRDLSMGKLIKREICFEKDECEVGNSKFKKILVDSDLEQGTEGLFSNNDSFLRKYDNYGEHNVSIYLKDRYGIEVKKEYEVKTSSNTNNGKIAPGVNMITIPETTFTNANPEIFLSKTMKNTLIMYINNENGGTCYVDTDITMDSDRDGKLDNDVDALCNKIIKLVYDSNYESATGRIYYTSDNNEIESKDFYVYIEQ